MDQLFEATPVKNEGPLPHTVPEPVSKAAAASAVDHEAWYQHLSDLDGLCAIGANGTKRPREVPGPMSAPPPPDESERPQQRLKTEQEPEQDQRVSQILHVLERVPPEAMSMVLANVFTITHRDFPSLSRPIPPKAEAITSWPHLFWEAEEEPEEGEDEEDLYADDEYQRPWIWEKVIDAAKVFTQLSELKWEIKETKEERRVAETVVIAMKDTQLMRTVWRRWLDGAGGGEGAGFCTGAATFSDSCQDQEEIHRIASTPKWYTHGFLGSVVLHRALLNSSRNVASAHQLLRFLNRHMMQQNLQANPELMEKYLWTVRTPEWINHWIAGDIPTPDAWLGAVPARMRHPPKQWPLGWFAPQVAHGFLYLDLLSPERIVQTSRLSTQVMQRTDSDGFIHPRAVKHLQFMRANMLDPLSAVPMVVRLPAELISNLGAGIQIRWGYTTASSRKSWVTLPRWESDADDADEEVFAPSHPKGIVSSVGLVISGIRASGHNRPPMLGLVMADEPGPPMMAIRGTRPKFYDGDPRVADADLKLFYSQVNRNIATPEERAAVAAARQRIYDARQRAWVAAGLGGPNATDNFGHGWHAIVTDIWMADIRFDSPSSILLWFSRVGARYHLTLATANASTTRSIEPRLSDQHIPQRILWPRYMMGRRLRVAAGEGSDAYHPQDDEKTLILSRCWAAPAKESWLRGRSPSPQFYDHDRDLWVLDVGDSTAFFKVLMLLRCYGGPALPTLLPDLGRVRYLVYTVPVYRMDSDPQQEDLERIANHGRIDRLLMFPKKVCIFDRVAMSRELFTNAQGWISGYAVYDENHGIMREAPPIDLIHRRPIDRYYTRLVYEWDRQALKKVELEYWRIHKDIDDLTKRAWRDFRLPWWKESRLARTSLPAAVELVYWAKGMGNARSVRVGWHNLEWLQWTNMLFAINKTGSQGAYTGKDFSTIQGDPLGDWMRAMDQASPYVTATHTWLTSHRQLRYLGARVSWGAVAFGTHDPTRGRQLSVRLGVTELPWRGGHEGSPGLFDRLMSRKTQRRVRNERDTIRGYDIVDLSGNPIDDNTRSREGVVRINKVYDQPKRDGMMVMIGPARPGQPMNRLCQLLRRAAEADENFSLGVFAVNAPELLLRIARDWASRRLDLSGATRLVVLMMHYRPARNLELTMPEGGGMIEYWPQTMPPDVAKRVNALSKSNPYGESAKFP